MRYDYLIVGAGPFGATFARAATDRGQRCLVIDKRGHVGGNAHCETIEGILVHMYGAHLFHTASPTIWNFVRQFGDWRSYRHTVRARVGSRLFSMPVNLMTMHQLWGVCTPDEAKRKLAEVRTHCDRAANAEEWLLSQIGRELYELLFRGYTKKQWLKEPRELPASIVQRLPIRLTYNDNYFDDEYQGLPIEGYTKVVENMLTGIDVERGTDFFALDWRKYANRLVFTGPIDRFFNHQLGRLDYRLLRFEMYTVAGDFQGHSVVNYPDESVPYLRIVEHKHFLDSGPKHIRDERTSPTVITLDYPVAPGTPEFMDNPQYPIRDAANLARYEGYASLGRMLPDVLFGGRLAEYRYYDMDQAIGSALAKVHKYVPTRETIRVATTAVVSPTNSTAEAKAPALDDLFVYALAHNEARFAAIPTLRYVGKVRLDQLIVRPRLRCEQLAEARAFLDESLDFQGCDYRGFLNARWNEKYAANIGRNFPSPQSIRLEEFSALTGLLAPDVVLTPQVAQTAHGPAGWATYMDQNFAGMAHYLAEIEGIGYLSLAGNAPSVWNNNFICHRQVMDDFLSTWREAFGRLFRRHGFQLSFALSPHEMHRRFGFLAEHMTLMYFSSRPDLRVVPVPSSERPRLRPPIREPRANRAHSHGRATSV